MSESTPLLLLNIKPGATNHVSITLTLKNVRNWGAQALFGALFGGTIELVLPPALYLLDTLATQQERRVLTMNVVLLVVGVAAVASGTFSAAQELTKSDTAPSSNATSALAFGPSGVMPP